MTTDGRPPTSDGPADQRYLRRHSFHGVHPTPVLAVPYTPDPPPYQHQHQHQQQHEEPSLLERHATLRRRALLAHVGFIAGGAATCATGWAAYGWGVVLGVLAVCVGAVGVARLCGSAPTLSGCCAARGALHPHVAASAIIAALSVILVACAGASIALGAGPPLFSAICVGACGILLASSAVVITTVRPLEATAEAIVSGDGAYVETHSVPVSPAPAVILDGVAVASLAGSGDDASSVFSSVTPDVRCEPYPIVHRSGNRPFLPGELPPGHDAEYVSPYDLDAVAISVDPTPYCVSDSLETRTIGRTAAEQYRHSSVFHTDSFAPSDAGTPPSAPIAC